MRRDLFFGRKGCVNDTTWEHGTVSRSKGNLSRPNSPRYPQPETELHLLRSNEIHDHKLLIVNVNSTTSLLVELFELLQFLSIEYTKCSYPFQPPHCL